MPGFVFTDWPRAWSFSPGDYERVAQEYFAIKLFKIKSLQYFFVNDARLIEINRAHLQHDDYTDIITFDYSRGTRLSGEIWISWERVNENAQERQVAFQQEAYRVMVHGLLHLAGFKDKTEHEARQMRAAEEDFLKFAGLFHVEQ